MHRKGKYMRNNIITLWIEKYKDSIIIDDNILTMDIRGIYGIFIADCQKEECIYVGKAINIRKRIFAHLSAVKWYEMSILKRDVEHIRIIANALKEKKIVRIKVLEVVDYEYLNYNRDIHHLAYREYWHIEDYQKKGQCLNQRPEGSYNDKEYKRWKSRNKIKVQNE